MALDGRLPVIVGGGQVCRRADDGDDRDDGDPGDDPEPVDLLAEALRRAEEDAGLSGGRLLTAADSVRVVQILSWRYRDAGRAVAERLGASPRHTLYTGPGGQWPQALVNRTALDIQAGRADVVLLGGAETWRSRTRARSAGHHRSWPRQADTLAPTELLGEDAAYGHPAELACGVILPIQHYPLIESALRTAAGRTPSEHETVLAELWSRFSEVAAANPDAWARQAYSPAELLEVTPANRMIGLPYRKRWCSNNHVDMAAGLVLCSVARATTLGIPRERWVFPWAGSDADDAPFVSVRADLHRSPAIRSAGEMAFRLAGSEVDDVDHVDLYSCFPSAVELGAIELGLGLDRPLTVTGGLPFAGGPWNDYVTHALATMAGRLRADPGSIGLVTGLGGFATKHAVGLYSTEPPDGGFRWEPGVSVPPEREAAEGYVGPAAVEAWTVMYDREGDPETGIATCLTSDGRRAWATTHQADALAAMVTDELAGRAVTVGTGGALQL